MPSSLLLDRAAQAARGEIERTPECFKELALEANWVRRKVVDMAVYAKSGHVTTAFSQTELLVAMYLGGIMRHDPKNPEWPDRDRFVISKGQGGIGLYAVLAKAGYFPLSELDNFCGPGSHLGVHVEAGVPGIEVLSGSLGHGLPIATGIAQVGKNENRDWLVFCMTGDAELYEGSNWEAATYASHAELGNLVVIVDRNQQGVLGFSDDIRSAKDGPRTESLDDKFQAFGFETLRFNGHDFGHICDAFEGVRERKSDKPLCLIADTIKGKGGSVFENKRLWHYHVPAGDDLEQVYADLEAERKGLVGE